MKRFVLSDDEDPGKIVIISGAGSPYPIEELAPDLRSFKTDAPKPALQAILSVSR